jgi:hypothetical protein
VKTHIYLNDHPDHYAGFKPEHINSLTRVTGFTMPDSRSDNDALESAFQVGNGADPESDSLYYSHGVRSISVGDVIVVERETGNVMYGCASFGWDLIDPDVWLVK